MNNRDGATGGPESPEVSSGLDMLEALADNSATPEVRERLEQLAKRSVEWREAVNAYTPRSAWERKEMIAAVLAAQSASRDPSKRPILCPVEVHAAAGQARAWWRWLLEKLFHVRTAAVAPAAVMVFIWFYPWPIASYEIAPDGVGRELCRSLRATAGASGCRVWTVRPERELWFPGAVEAVAYEGGASPARVAATPEKKKGTVEILRPDGYPDGKDLYFVVARAGKLPATLELALKECPLPGSDCQVIHPAPDASGASGRPAGHSPDATQFPK